MSGLRALPILLCLAACTGLGGCGRAADAPHAPPPPVLDALLGERIHEPLAELAARVPLAPDQDFKVVELGRSAHTSQHVGAIRTGEAPHRHDHHDLLVLIVHGQGAQRVGDETRPVSAGSLLFVPKGTVHAFTNTGPEPAIAYLVYAPPFDGSDRVPATSPDAQPGPPQ